MNLYWRISRHCNTPRPRLSNPAVPPNPTQVPSMSPWPHLSGRLASFLCQTPRLSLCCFFGIIQMIRCRSVERVRSSSIFPFEKSRRASERARGLIPIFRVTNEGDSGGANERDLGADFGLASPSSSPPSSPSPTSRARASCPMSWLSHHDRLIPNIFIPEKAHLHVTRWQPFYRNNIRSCETRRCDATFNAHHRRATNLFWSTWW